MQTPLTHCPPSHSESSVQSGEVQLPSAHGSGAQSSPSSHSSAGTQTPSTHCPPPGQSSGLVHPSASQFAPSHGSLFSTQTPSSQIPEGQSSSVAHSRRTMQSPRSSHPASCGGGMLASKFVVTCSPHPKAANSTARNQYRKRAFMRTPWRADGLCKGRFIGRSIGRTELGSLRKIREKKDRDMTPCAVESIGESRLSSARMTE